MLNWVSKILNYINQHKNDMCHVQSFEKDLYLGAPNSFDLVFTQ